MRTMLINYFIDPIDRSFGETGFIDDFILASQRLHTHTHSYYYNCDGQVSSGTDLTHYRAIKIILMIINMKSKINHFSEEFFFHFVSEFCALR